MKLAFKMKPDSFIGHVVALVSVPIHVEPIFSDGKSFRAMHGAPCSFVDAPQETDQTWRIVDLSPLGLYEPSARAYCESIEGEPYDDVRSVAGWFGAALDRVTAGNCCEVSATALVLAGAPPVLLGKPSTLPKRLYAAVLSLLPH